MKYEQQLLFNAQSEWTDHYIAYSTLKAAVYKAEKEALQYRLGGAGAGTSTSAQTLDDEERGGLLANEGGGSDGTEDQTSSEALAARFRALGDGELAKIESFYEEKEKELYDQLDSLKEEVEQVEEEGAFGDIDEEGSGDDESGESGDEDGAAGLLKKGGKLLRSALGGGGGSNAKGSGSGARRESSEEERTSGSNALARRRSSSLPPKPQISHGRKRSGTGSDGSNASSTDALRRVDSQTVAAEGELPPEAVEEIDNQLDRTMLAATPGHSGPSERKSTTSTRPMMSPSGEVQHVPPVSPYSSNGKSARRRRASSFGAGAGASNGGVGTGASSGDIWSSNSRQAIDMKITFKLRLQGLFRDLSQLKEYVSLNQSACTYYLICLSLESVLTAHMVYSWLPQDPEEVRQGDLIKLAEVLHVQGRLARIRLPGEHAGTPR